MVAADSSAIALGRNILRPLIFRHSHGARRRGGEEPPGARFAQARHRLLNGARAGGQASMTFFALASSFVPTLPDGLFGSRAVMPNGYADRRPGPPPASPKGDSRAPSPKPRAQSPGSAGIQLLGPSCAPILPTLLSGRCLVAGFKAPNNPLCPPFPRSSRTSAYHRAEVLVCAAEGSPHKSFWAYGAGCHQFLWTVAVFRAPMSDPGLREISGGLVGSW